MNDIRGVIEVMPFTGIMILLGVFALTGFPPFSIFVSEIMIVIAAFLKGSYFVAGILLITLSIIFGSFIYYFGKMLFDKGPKDMQKYGEPVSGKLALLFLSVPLCASGVLLPIFKKDLIWILQGLFQR